MFQIQQFSRMIEEQNTIICPPQTDPESEWILRDLIDLPETYRLTKENIEPTLNLKVGNQVDTICKFIAKNFQICKKFLVCRVYNNQTHSTGSQFLQSVFILIFVKFKIINEKGSSQWPKIQNVSAQLSISQESHLNNNQSVTYLESNSSHSSSQLNSLTSISGIEDLNSSSMYQQVSRILNESSCETTKQDAQNTQSLANCPWFIQATIKDLILNREKLIKTIVQILWHQKRYKYIKYLLDSEKYKKYASSKIKDVQRTAIDVFFKVMPQLNKNIFQPEVYFYIVRNCKFYLDKKEFIGHLKEMQSKYVNKQENGFSSIDLNQIGQITPKSFILIGNQYLKQGNTAQKAFFYCILGLKIHPQDLKLQYFLVLGLKATGHLQKAALALNNLITQHKSLQRDDLFVFLITLAQIDAKLQNTESSLKNLQHASQILKEHCNKSMKQYKDTTPTDDNKTPTSSQQFWQQIDLAKAMAFFYAQDYMQAYQILKIIQSNNTNRRENQYSRKRQLYLAITAFKIQNFNDCSIYLEKFLLNYLNIEYFFEIDPLEYLWFLKELRRVKHSCQPVCYLMISQNENNIKSLIEASQKQLLLRATDLFVFVTSLIKKGFKNDALLILQYIRSQLSQFVDIGQAFRLMVDQYKVEEGSFILKTEIKTEIEKIPNIKYIQLHLQSLKHQQSKFYIKEWLYKLNLPHEQVFENMKIELGDIYKKQKDYRKAFKYYYNSICGLLNKETPQNLEEALKQFFNKHKAKDDQLTRVLYEKIGALDQDIENIEALDKNFDKTKISYFYSQMRDFQRGVSLFEKIVKQQKSVTNHIKPKLNALASKITQKHLMIVLWGIPQFEKKPKSVFRNILPAKLAKVLDNKKWVQKLFNNIKQLSQENQKQLLLYLDKDQNAAARDIYLKLKNIIKKP